MGESKYIELLNKLIEDILNTKKKNLPTLKNSTKQLIDEINNFINSNQKSPSEKDIKETLSDYFIRQLRLRFQKEIIKNISNESKLISDNILIYDFIFWLMNETQFI